MIITNMVWTRSSDLTKLLMCETTDKNGKYLDIQIPRFCGKMAYTQFLEVIYFVTCSI